MLSRLHTTRLAAWYTAAGSIPVTAALLAFGGGTVNHFMFWLLLIGFTVTTTGRIWVWWTTNHRSRLETPPESATPAIAPQISGDSRLPQGAFFG